MKEIATAHDAAKWASHYADSATLLAPGMEPMSGKEAITKGLDMMLKDPALKLTFAPAKVYVAQAGDMAYTVGSYEMTMTNPATKKVGTDKGSYVTVYHKQADGSWKVMTDINTPSK